MMRKGRKKARRASEEDAAEFEAPLSVPESDAPKVEDEEGDGRESAKLDMNLKAGAGKTKKGTGNGGISTYVFTFELIKQYPTVRSFIVKQPLKRSFGDSLSDLFGGSKKGIYKL